MGQFPSSCGFSYILLAVDDVSKWVEAKATRTDDSAAVIGFVKSHIFNRFEFHGLSSVIKGVISAIEQWEHYSRSMASTITWQQPITLKQNGQAEVSNREVKSILEKTKCNFDLGKAGVERKLQFQELEEMRLDAYENTRLYKEKTKAFHDSFILRKQFDVGQKVLLYNSRLKLMPGKLRSRWIGPFEVSNVFSYGAVEIRSFDMGKTFKVNGHRLKPFMSGDTAENFVDVALA
ncbi:UNVERIFIED_CONTAM: hypothetical protein Sradi_5704500 [Sesamum radiatum]|uniref:Uncharacterized protein n=1 Tax=Sesamum radiatum TaxID=300843 RepID=A0AAW2L190_SESRA